MANKTTVEWQDTTFTFVDTAWGDVVFLRMRDKFASDNEPDQGARSDMCYVLANLDSVKGTKWKPVDDTATEDQFRECYKGLLQMGSYEQFQALVHAAMALKNPKAGKLDKPDETLTDEEQADPN